MPINHIKLSEGEEMIGDILFEMNIKYEDQKEIRGLKNDSKKFRIADFYLPKLEVYLEFLGNWSDEKRQKEYIDKIHIYKENNIPCIYIWSDNLGQLEWIFKERLRAELLTYKKYWILFQFEIKEFLKNEWRLLMILGMIIYVFKNKWITIGVLALTIAIFTAYYIHLKRRIKRIKARHGID